MSDKSNLELTIFGKSKTNREGRKFDVFFTRLTNKTTGESTSFNVKFRMNGPQLDLSECPCVIRVPRTKINRSEKPILDPEGEPVYDEESGELKVSRTLWVTTWEMVGPYVDHSLDDYE